MWLQLTSDMDLSVVRRRRSQLCPQDIADANMSYISANAMLKSAWSYFNYGDKMLDSTSFISVIEKYRQGNKGRLYVCCSLCKTGDNNILGLL